jgi:hypothetical protein
MVEEAFAVWFAKEMMGHDERWWRKSCGEVPCEKGSALPQWPGVLTDAKRHGGL